MSTKPALLFSGEMAQSGESGVDRCLFFFVIFCYFFYMKGRGCRVYRFSRFVHVAFLYYLSTAAAVVSLQTG